MHLSLVHRCCGTEPFFCLALVVSGSWFLKSLCLRSRFLAPVVCITVQNFKQFRHLPRKLYQGLCEVQSRKVRLRLRLLSYNLTFYETKSEDSQSSIQEANIFLRFRTWPYRWKMRSFTLMKPVSDQSWTQLKTGLRSVCRIRKPDVAILLIPCSYGLKKRVFSSWMPTSDLCA